MKTTLGYELTIGSSGSSEGWTKNAPMIGRPTRLSEMNGGKCTIIAYLFERLLNLKLRFVILDVAK